MVTPTAPVADEQATLGNNFSGFVHNSRPLRSYTLFAGYRFESSRDSAIDRGTYETGSSQNLANFCRSFLSISRHAYCNCGSTRNYKRYLEVITAQSPNGSGYFTSRSPKKIMTPEFPRPRRLFEQFKVEVLCTSHRSARSAQRFAHLVDWQVLPTFRPDKCDQFRERRAGKHIDTFKPDQRY